MGATIGAGRFDVFLSHNSRDKPAVERIAEQLKRAGLEPWLDKWCLTPGGRWQEELDAGMRASSACAYFVGPHGEGDWAREELGIARDRAAKEYDFRLFPVLLPGLPDVFDTTLLPPFLSTRTWVDLRQGIDDPRGLQRLINAIKGVAPGPEVPIAQASDECPYRGLQTFDEAHADLFFGREGDVQRLLEKLKAARFLAVLGPSGSGKSSLVRAGLIPALRRGRLPGSERWNIGVVTPGAHPLTALAAGLLRLYPQDSMRHTIEELGRDERTLHFAVALAWASRGRGDRMVWVIDQCEEIFTLCRDDHERERFLANLLYAASIPDGPDVVIITMRADFYPRCAAYPEFATQVSANQFLVSPLDLEGLRQAIVEPARRCGLEFEQGLVATILQDVADRPGSLPLLEHALLELWERRRGHMLTLEGYRESGGVQGAIAKRAEDIFDGFTPEQQAITRRALLRLTQPGEGTEDTRRRATLSELLPSADVAAAVEAVVNRLTDARLLTTSGDAAQGGPWVDISHEALIRSWPRLRSWLDEDREALVVHRRLTEAAQEWQRLGRDPDALFRGLRLAEAVEWKGQHAAELNDLEREFLQASVALQERERAAREAEQRARERLRQRLTRAALGLALFFLMLAGLAGVQWWRSEESRRYADEQRSVAEQQRALAEEQRQIAEQQRALALVRQLAAQAELARTSRANLLPQAVVFAVEALQRGASPEATQTLRRALSLLARPLAHLTHDDYVQALVFSPDGRLLATASGDGTARLWDPATGQEVRRLALAGAASAVVFSPGGRLLATASGDGAVVLWEVGSGQELRRLAHAGGVNALAFSPDGRLLATASGDGTARLWDPATGQEVRRLAHESVVNWVVFSPDGRLLATASEDRTARVWDAASGQQLARFAHDGDILRAVFSPDGRLLATASDDTTARLWEIASGRELQRLEHGREVRRLAFSPDGRYLATAGLEPFARLWEVAHGREIARLDHENGVNAVAFSPDGRHVATASSDGTARVWDAGTGRELARMPDDKAVWTLAFSPDGARLATANVAGSVRIWEATSHDEAVRLPHEAEVTALAYRRDGRVLATASWDHTVRVWDAASGEQLLRLPHPDRVFTVAFSPDGTLLATGGQDAAAHLWDATSGRELARLSHEGTVLRLAFSPDGRYLATASQDRTARIWEVASGQEVLRLPHPHEVGRVAFSPDGRYLATARGVRSASGDPVAGNVAFIWDVSTGQEVARLVHEGDVTDVAFSPDGRYLATAGWEDRLARLWEVGSFRELARYPHDAFVSTLAFGPASRHLATASVDGVTHLWAIESGVEAARLAHDNAFLYAVAFSPDGQYLATASGDGTARLWDVADGTELARFTHERGVIRAAFSPDGRFLATASLDQTARLWPVGPQNLIADACAHLVRNLTEEEWRHHLPDEPYHRACPDLP